MHCSLHADVDASPSDGPAFSAATANALSSTNSEQQQHSPPTVARSLSLSPADSGVARSAATQPSSMRIASASAAPDDDMAAAAGDDEQTSGRSGLDLGSPVAAAAAPPVIAMVTVRKAPSAKNLISQFATPVSGPSFSAAADVSPPSASASSVITESTLQRQPTAAAAVTLLQSASACDNASSPYSGESPHSGGSASNGNGSRGGRFVSLNKMNKLKQQQAAAEEARRRSSSYGTHAQSPLIPCASSSSSGSANEEGAAVITRAASAAPAEAPKQASAAVAEVAAAPSKPSVEEAGRRAQPPLTMTSATGSSDAALAAESATAGPLAAPVPMPASEAASIDSSAPILTTKAVPEVESTAQPPPAVAPATVQPPTPEGLNPSQRRLWRLRRMGDANAAASKGKPQQVAAEEEEAVSSNAASSTAASPPLSSASTLSARARAAATLEDERPLGAQNHHSRGVSSGSSFEADDNRPLPALAKASSGSNSSIIVGVSSSHTPSLSWDEQPLPGQTKGRTRQLQEPPPLPLTSAASSVGATAFAAGSVAFGIDGDDRPIGGRGGRFGRQRISPVSSTVADADSGFPASRASAPKDGVPMVAVPLPASRSSTPALSVDDIDIDDEGDDVSPRNVTDTASIAVVSRGPPVRNSRPSAPPPPLPPLSFGGISGHVRTTSCTSAADERPLPTSARSPIKSQHSFSAFPSSAEASVPSASSASAPNAPRGSGFTARGSYALPGDRDSASAGDAVDSLAEDAMAADAARAAAAEAAEAAIATIPLSQRLTSKDAKQRKHGWVELMKACQQQQSRGKSSSASLSEEQASSLSSIALWTSGLSDTSALVSDACTQAMGAFLLPTSGAPQLSSLASSVFSTPDSSAKLLKSLYLKFLSGKVWEPAADAVAGLIALDVSSSPAPSAAHERAGVLVKELTTRLKNLKQPKVAVAAAKALSQLALAGASSGDPSTSTLASALADSACLDDVIAAVPSLLLASSPQFREAGAMLAASLRLLRRRDVDALLASQRDKAAGGSGQFAPAVETALTNAMTSVAETLAARGSSSSSSIGGGALGAASRNGGAAGRGSAAADDGPEDPVAAAAAEDRRWEAAKPSDVSKELAKLDLSSALPAAPKFDAKVAALQSALAIISRYTRLGPDAGAYSELSGTLNRLFVGGKSEHVNVQAAALELWEALCVRLRAKAAPIARTALPVAIACLGDKKATVVRPASSLLSSCLRYGCLGLDELLASLRPLYGKEVAKPSPEAKRNALALLTSALVSPVTLPSAVLLAPTSGRLAAIGDLFVAVTAEPAGELRAEAEKGLVTLLLRAGFPHPDASSQRHSYLGPDIRAPPVHPSLLPVMQRLHASNAALHDRVTSAAASSGSSSRFAASRGLPPSSSASAAVSRSGSLSSVTSALMMTTTMSAPVAAPAAVASSSSAVSAGRSASVGATSRPGTAASSSLSRKASSATVTPLPSSSASSSASAPAPSRAARSAADAALASYQAAIAP